ncbi:hypothetical protein BO82DRAFT_277279 [Aspergillus uvarum CBS 121591]|uniref:Complex 1 LYR protein domain-containing protein n=1 Tax=Aspergillus uvarum CBS 121591 TaxID=1448315 RepID=A0A319CF12_9EURO|nr:hypothetical protein BO82DRAFT_277279 [Aspergillus uvarum CBS 121591]PYH84436.1 hypothetical protein BO82DRAFT_277279 [Aspergillus uvarum CBS 121591]
MHKLVVPNKSSIHRFTALALYRALLRQCAKLPENLAERNAPKQHIQLRFHRYKGLESPSRVTHALKAGYDALDLLHAVSQGRRTETKHLRTLLSEAAEAKERQSAMQRELARLKPRKPPSALELKKRANREATRRTMSRHPDAIPVLSRPRPVVSGIRRIPKLVNARGVPFLRINKPQPAILGHIIRGKQRKRNRTLRVRSKLQEARLWAQDEDEWDRLTDQAEREPTATWRHPVELCIMELKRRVFEMERKDHELATAMWKVVLAERALAAKEAKERAAKMAADAPTETTGGLETEQKAVGQLERAELTKHST